MMDIIFAYVQGVWQYIAMAIALTMFWLKMRREKLDGIARSKAEDKERKEQREADRVKFEDELKKAWEADKLSRSNEHRIENLEKGQAADRKGFEEYKEEQREQKRECDLKAKEAKEKDDATRSERVATIYKNIDGLRDEQCQMKQDIVRVETKVEERTKGG